MAAEQVQFYKLGSPVDVAIVIVTFMSEAAIDVAIRSIRETSPPGLRLSVVVVDNDSADGTCDRVRAEGDVQLVSAGGNIGYGAAINVALAEDLNADTVMILNPDLVVLQDAIVLLSSKLRDCREIGMVVPRITTGAGQSSYSLRREPSVLRTVGDSLLGSRFRGRPGWFGEIVYDSESYENSGFVEWATGAAVAIRREAIESVGNWDERFFLYSEEVDFARRMRDRGWRVFYEPAAHVAHDGGGSGKSAVLDALLLINRARYAYKYHGFGTACATWLVLLAGQMLRVGTSGGFTRVRLLARPWLWRRVVEDRLGGALRDHPLVGERKE